MEKSGETAEKQEYPEEEQGSPEARLKRLEEILSEKDRALAEANTAIAEMKRTRANLDGEINELRQRSAALEEKLTVVSHSLKGAVENYRTLLAGSNPGVTGELVTGDTIESVNDSLEKAKALVSRVRQGLETEILASKIPIGAPARTAPSLSSLSPREKISYAMGRNP